MNMKELQIRGGGGKRNGEIDLLRFVFICIIVCFHFNNSYQFGFFSKGSIGVEFFLVVSGFLMANHVSRNHSEHTELKEIADETWRYLIRKA